MNLNREISLKTLRQSTNTESSIGGRCLPGQTIAALFFLIFGFLLLSTGVKAQDMNNPGDYMTAINKARGDMDTKYMQYVSAAAHGRRARKVEKLRLEVLDNITQSRYKTTDLPLYKGDNSLRQAAIAYIQMCYIIFSEDYKKIVNMEELAE